MIFVVVCLGLTQQDDIERFYISIRGTSSSTAFSGDIHLTREPPPVVLDIPLSGAREAKRADGTRSCTDLIELDYISPVHHSHTSPV
jgi:hypothetical protein